MRFTQPNNLSRVMSQILDQLGPERSLTLQFASEGEAERGLAVLNEVAQARSIGVVVTPVREHVMELRLAKIEAA